MKQIIKILIDSMRTELRIDNLITFVRIINIIFDSIANGLIES